MMDKIVRPPLPDLFLTDSAAFGAQLALDMFIELHEGESQIDTLLRYSDSLAEGVADESYQANREFLAGFLESLLDLIPNLKTKPLAAKSTAQQAGVSGVSSPHMSMKRLACEIGMDRSACRRYVMKLGIEPVKRRTGDSGFQAALTVTAEQAAKIKRIRVEEGYLAQPAMPEPLPKAAPTLKEFSDADLINELRRRVQCGQR